MRNRLVLLGLFAAGFLALAGGSSAGTSGSAVFVQTNELSGNQIAVYDRNSDGTLTRAGTYATGGLGGAGLPRPPSDPLPAQGSLVPPPDLFLVVYPRGNTISLFRGSGDRASLDPVRASGRQ